MKALSVFGKRLKATISKRLKGQAGKFYCVTPNSIHEAPTGTMFLLCMQLCACSGCLKDYKKRVILWSTEIKAKKVN